MIAIAEDLKIEVSEIKSILNLLSNLFSIRTAFIYNIADENYHKEIAGNNGDFQSYCKTIQRELKHKCIACDRDKFKLASESRKPLLYRCYNGLYEMFLPLFLDDILVGYLHFGQVRSEDCFDTIKKECNLSDHKEILVLEKQYNQMEIISKEKLLLLAELFLKISENILKNSLIDFKKHRPEIYLKKYIEENLSNEISIEKAADFIGRSPSYVTHTFKKIYDTSFYDYVIQKRIEKAKIYLKSKSIAETAECTGFKNRYHFSKVFKKVTGVTPKAYQVNV